MLTISMGWDMKKEKSLLRICIILITITIVSGTAYSYLTKLKEPVFLRYCVAACAVPSPETGYQEPVLELQYLTNSDDTREVTGLQFLEAHDYSFIATENAMFYNNSVTFYSSNTPMQRGELYGRYSLRKVYLYMNNYYLEDWKGEVELNNAQVNFNDGSSLLVNLGKILIYSDIATDPTLLMMNSSSSNQGYGETILRAQQNLNDFKVESLLIDEASHKMELTLNGLLYDDIEMLQLKKGDSLTVTSCEKSYPDKKDTYDFYDVRPRLTFTREDGSRGSVRIYDMNQRKYFYGYMDVLKYLMGRGAF